ncbi:MAG: tRNA (guanosine(46)-N7)-methyltransferase TrmB [Paludibacteraceae bacterium]|nr:tRNA (guanosine(46)-N7)-methyltransferase TrmB [Paludibacteraceae bacterium]
MSKNKLTKFAEMKALDNVFECSVQELEEKDYRRFGDRKHELAGGWHDVFGNRNPIVLELGCGRGEYTVGLAERYPEKNFIGIDIKGARMWAGAKQAKAKGLPNAAFLRTNIEMLPYFFTQDEVAEIWITFPDPQMKKATKRLTSTFFMARYRLVLRDGGLVHLKTDSPFLYTYTREMLRVNNQPVNADLMDLYAGEAPIDLDIRTHYEQQWLDRGLTIKYLQWALPHAGELTEPEIEIEFDTYKSYGRGVL